MIPLKFVSYIEYICVFSKRMTISTKMLLLSLFLVMSMVYSSALPVVDAFHAPMKPIFYVNFFEDEMISETDTSKIEENNIFNYSDLDSKLQTIDKTSRSTQGDKTSQSTQGDKTSQSTQGDKTSQSTQGGKTSQSIQGDKSSQSTQGTKLHLPTTSVNSQQHMGLYENNENELFNTSTVERTDMDSVSTDTNLLQSSDDISMQFTKIYLKAITNLIERIMDALFSVSEPSTITRSNEVPTFDYDSSETRKLKKREVSLTESELSESHEASSANNEVGSTNQSLDSNLGSTTIKSSSFQTTSESASKEKEQTLAEIENSLEMNGDTKQKNTIDVHITVVHDKPSTASDISTSNAGLVQLKEKLLDKEVNSKPEMLDDVPHINDLMNNSNSAMMDDSITKQDGVYPEGINLLSDKPRFAEEPREDEDTESASSAAAVTIGTLLIVIVFVAAGSAAAYTLRKRRLNQSQSGNLAQHTAMA